MIGAFLKSQHGMHYHLSVTYIHIYSVSRVYIYLLYLIKAPLAPLALIFAPHIYNRRQSVRGLVLI